MLGGSIYDNIARQHHMPSFDELPSSSNNAQPPSPILSSNLNGNISSSGAAKTDYRLLLTRLHHLKKLTMRLDTSFHGLFIHMLMYIYAAGGSKYLPSLESASFLNDINRDNLVLLS